MHMRRVGASDGKESGRLTGSECVVAGCGGWQQLRRVCLAVAVRTTQIDHTPLSQV